MGYIDTASAAEGTEISIDTGKGEIKATIESMPFLRNTSIKYKED